MLLIKYVVGIEGIKVFIWFETLKVFEVIKVLRDIRKLGKTGMISLGKYFEEAGIRAGDTIEIIAKEGQVIIRKVVLKPVCGDVYENDISKDMVK
jgi:hypothetical protein